MTWSKLPALILGAALLAGCQPSMSSYEPLPAASTDASRVYTLGTGDRVRLTVFNEPNLSGEFAVDPSGHISAPMLGAIEATGLTARQLEERIVARLKQGYLRDPQVSVEVMTYRPVYILGEVNKPGEYPYSSDMTFLTAVASAGGYTPRANQGYVIVERVLPNGQTTGERRATPQMKAMPGDVIRVPERFF